MLSFLHVFVVIGDDGPYSRVLLSKRKRAKEPDVFILNLVSPMLLAHVTFSEVMLSANPTELLHCLFIHYDCVHSHAERQ